MVCVVAVFPGQGSQRMGMAADFCEAFPESLETFRQASDAIGVDMASLCHREDARLNLTEFTQPAILTAEVAMFRAMVKHFGFMPSYFGGHSLGEYTALVAAGVLPLEVCLRIVKKRGALMQNAVPVGVGAMAALVFENIAETDYLRIVHESEAEVANINSTSQVVVSGRKEAVQLASANLKEAYPKMSIIPLNVSAPFHCTLMKEIESEFKDFLVSYENSFEISKASRVASNFSGDFHTPDTLISNLVRQISGSVRWVDNMRTLIASKGEGEVFEIGPSRVLSKFFSSLALTAKAVTDMRSLEKNLGNPSGEG